MRFDHNPYRDVHHSTRDAAIRSGNLVALDEQRRLEAVAAGDVAQQTPRERARAIRTGGY